MGWSNDRFGIIGVQDDNGTVHFARSQSDPTTQRVEQCTQASTLVTSTGNRYRWLYISNIQKLLTTGQITSTALGTMKRNILY